MISVLVWNNKKHDVGWIPRFEEILNLYYEDTPRKVTGQWKEVFVGYKPLSFIEHAFLPGSQSLKVKCQCILLYIIMFS